MTELFGSLSSREEAIDILRQALSDEFSDERQLDDREAYLQGIDPSEVIDAVRSRRQPTISATAGLRL